MVILFFTYLKFFLFLFLHSDTGNFPEFSQVHVNTYLCVRMCSHTKFLILPSFCYCLGTLTFHTLTSTASHLSVNFLGGRSLMF